MHFIFWGKVVALVVFGTSGFLTLHPTKGSIEDIRVNSVDSKYIGTCTSKEILQSNGCIQNKIDWL